MSFHYTVQTDKSVTDAIQAIEQNLQGAKFGVLWQTSLTENLHNKGFTKVTAPYHVLEVCSPGVAEKVLLENDLAHYFMPCKITVYEKDGKTNIGLPKPTALIGLVGDENLKEVAEEIEQKLIEVVEKSK